MLIMGCSKSENMMFWNSVFIDICSFPKGVPFEGNIKRNPLWIPFCFVNFL
jgi:hypothetical protein